MTDRAYKLGKNLDHSTANEDYDVWQVTQNLNETFKDLFWNLEPIEKLPLCKFEGKLQERLNWLDYPDEEFGYPIVSKKMLDVLLSVGKFQHQAIPLKIYDYQSEDRTNNFAFLHLLECINVLDREKTKFFKASGRVRQAALKEPKDGYPPLFRVKNAGLARFISAEAKEALEAANIKGVRFVPLIAS